MKVNGIKLKGVRLTTLHIDLGDTVVEFKFRPLSSSDDDNFETVMPKPKPPKFMKPGGTEFYNTDDPKYKKHIEDWGQYKFHWEILRSLTATDGLEWSKVKMEDPGTWKLWEEEVTENFGKNTVGAFYNKYIEANIITEEGMEKARQRFLAFQALKLVESSFPTLEQQSTESGEPAKDSESPPQE